MNTFQLFLGRNIPDQTVTVTDQQIKDFLRFVVQPRFDGFTIQQARIIARAMCARHEQVLTVEEVQPIETH
jgi:Protein of unknown function (DUF3574)